MKKIVLLAMGLVMSMTAIAQDEIETTISGDIVSSYIWRGQDLGNVSLQPTLGIGYKGLSLTAWGNVGLSNSEDTKEFDLTLAYTTGGFNIGITDYWFNAGLDPDNRYFMYNAHSTNHVFEANIGYDFGFASLQWYTNFAGNDGVNKSGKRAYSSYFGRLDCHSGCHSLRHDVLQRMDIRVLCHQPRAEGDEGYQDHRFVLDSYLRTGGREPSHTESLPGSGFHAATFSLSHAQKELVSYVMA